MIRKPKLIPVKVPWEICPSTPHLQLSVAETEEPTRVWAYVNFPKKEMIRIVMSFGRSLYAHFAHSWSDSEVVREDHYDWSAVPDLDLDNLESSQKEFWTNWEKLGVCPDPNMYKVAGSLWLSEVQDNRPLQHFLILGHDAYVEVLAEDWTWEMVNEVHTSSLKDLSITDDP